jgi:hypothetical protein
LRVPRERTRRSSGAHRGCLWQRPILTKEQTE